MLVFYRDLVQANVKPTERHKLLPNLHLHPRDQPQRADRSDSGGRRICRLPDFQFPGLVRD